MCCAVGKPREKVIYCDTLCGWYQMKNMKKGFSLPSIIEFPLNFTSGNVPLTLLHLHLISMLSWWQRVRAACLCTCERDRNGAGKLVDLFFFLTECLLQCRKHLSCCSPTHPVSLLGHSACIKMEGLHF